MRHDSNLSENSEGESLDYEATKEMVSLVVRSPLRHPKLAAAIFLFFTALGIVAALLVTPMYQASEVVVITRNVLTPNIGQQTNQPNDYDPTTGVWEAVKGRDALVRLARQTHLVDKIQAPPARSGPLTEEAKLQVAVKLLEYRLNIRPDGNTVAFIADWTDPQTAYELATGWVIDFLETRKATEMSGISDAIALLEEHAKTEREGIETALGEFIKVKTGYVASAPTPGGAAPSAGLPVYRPAPPIGGPDPDLVKRLEDKKQQIRQTEDDWHRAKTEATARLNELLVTLTPSHPSVTALQRKVEQLSEEPANLKALKSEERSFLRELEAQVSLKAEKGTSRPQGGSSILPQSLPSTLARSNTPMSKQDLEVADPASAMALENLQSRVHKFNQYEDEIGDKKLQLDVARGAFQRRYSIFKPAEMPTKPRYPIRVILVWGGALLGLLLSIGIAAGLDLAGGRFIEHWQVKRRLSLPVLGEVAGP
jgi:uncharacterized protein involved in exopolysaccharide biosynthesis